MSDEYKYLGIFDDKEEYVLDGDFFTEKDEAIIRNIAKTGTFESLTVDSTFEDDHELCAEVTIDGAKIAMLWVVPEFFADIVYAAKGNEDAKKAVIDYIQDYVKEDK